MQLDWLGFDTDSVISTHTMTFALKPESRFTPKMRVGLPRRKNVRSRDFRSITLMKIWLRLNRLKLLLPSIPNSINK